MKRPPGPRPADTEHTPTHTPFSQRQGITWTFPSLFSGFPFGRPNPKYPPPDHPGGAGSKTIGRNPIIHTKVPFHPFLFVRFVPPTYHTHTCTHFLFHSCYYDCPVPIVHTCVASFRFPLSRFSLWLPEPQVPAAGSPGWRGFENHRPKTDHMYRSSLFPVLLRVFCTPDIPHTYVHPLSLSLWLKRLPRHSSCTLALRLFESPFSESWFTVLWFGTLHQIFPGLFPFDSPSLL